MSNGGYKGSSPARETSPEQYPGVWELTEQFQAQADGNWPFQETDCAPKSLRFNQPDSSSLSKTPNAAGNRKTFTLSLWIKRNKTVSNFNPTTESIFGAAGGSSWFDVGFYTVDELQVITNAGVGDTGCRTLAQFRDFSAWQSFVITVDTTDPTANDRIKIFHNGVRQEVSIPSGMPSVNSDTFVNSTVAHYFGRDARSSSVRYASHYLSEVHLIDGQALSCEEFGFFDGAGIWQPKRFTGDYSSGTFYSNFLTSSGSFATASEGPDKAFDGIATDASRAKGSTNNILTFDISSFGFTGLFELWSQNTGAEFSIDGGSNWSAVGDDVWTTVSSDISGVSTIQMRPDSGATMKVSAFRSQGQLLMDASVGRNSFHLDFADSSADAALGFDSSGLGNDWTPNNLSATGASSLLLNVDISTSLELYVTKVGNVSTQYVYVNGIDVTSQITVSSWSTITGVGTVLNSVKVTGNSSGTVYYALSGIKANGSWLIDTGTASPPTPNIIKDWSTDYLESNQYASRPIADAFNGEEGTYSTSFVGQTGGNVTAADIDCLVDTPVNGNQTDTANLGGIIQGNYATLNPLAKGSGTTLSNGNLDAVSGSSWSWAKGTIGVTSGKWYWEVTKTNAGADNLFTGIAKTTFSNLTYDLNHANSSSNDVYGYTSYNGNKEGQGSAASYGATFQTAGDIIGVALDMDAGTLTFYKNGATQGQAFSGITDEVCPAWGGTGSSISAANMNFGQRAFKYPLAGYKSLCTSNLPEPSIPIPSQYFDTKLWTGNGSTQTISNYNFSPDFVWMKARTLGSANHGLFDVIRGATKRLISNSSGDESTQSQTITSFNSDGFDLGTDAAYNGNNYPIVGWAWDAGESTTTIAAGSLNSSVYDQSQTWSNDVTGTAYGASYSAEKAFDGNFSTRSTGGSTGLTFTPSSAITVNSSLRVYFGYANSTATNVFSVNGTDYSSLITTGGSNVGWITVPGITSLTSLYYGVAPGGSEKSSVSAIEVDGKILVDSGVTLANVPSIASTVRANPSAGFSIVSYTGNSTAGANISHGLNAEPGLIIVKNRDQNDFGVVYHDSVVTTSDTGYYWLKLFAGTAGTDGKDWNANSGLNMWNNTNPTSSVFTVGDSANVNQNTEDYIAYCIAPVNSYSAMGSYTGNGVANDGPFVYTGFRPAFIMIKSTGAGHWFMYDDKRLGYNPANDQLTANIPDLEYVASSYPSQDFLSNGFKVLDAGGANRNTIGVTYIYLAFASHPFKTARAR